MHPCVIALCRCCAQAAHCLWDVDTNASFPHADFIPGFDPQPPPGVRHAPRGAGYSTALWSPPEFRQCPPEPGHSYTACHEGWDFGLVRLNVSFGDQFMDIGFRTRTDAGVIVNTAGYPGGLPQVVVCMKAMCT